MNVYAEIRIIGHAPSGLPGVDSHPALRHLGAAGANIHWVFSVERKAP